MGLFNKKISDNSKADIEQNTIMDKIEINERPRICCIDINQADIDLLNNNGFNINSGTLGSKIKIPLTTRNTSHQLLLNYDFPENLHEYDIIIIDLNNYKTIDYKSEEHTRINHTGKSAISLLSSYPETIFDPRPLGSMILHEKLRQIGTRDHIIVAFTTESYDIEYESVKISEGYSERQGVQSHNIYSFSGYTPLSEPKYGKEITVCKVIDNLKTLLESNRPKTFYNQTFHHPTVWEKDNRIPDSKYFPLCKNLSGDIVSISEARENSIVFYFPQIESKGEFINSLLTKILPDIAPEIFPFSTTFNWKINEEYWLPNHCKLLKEKESIEIEYKEKLESKGIEIETNNEKYSFLHEIITETGDKLVDSLINYLKWLGFRNVKKVDDENTCNGVLEEDIQVELDDGLLIIECKGIGGTSTDSDCSQISKIKHRRCKERNRFDVYALYIVNHQRYLPPLSRQNSPFSENQKQDAINDERGLLTTWQLFNLYNEIKNGVLNKTNARNDLLKFGFIEFRPNNLILIDVPKELFKNGEVCIVNITDIELNVGDEILVEKNGKFIKSTIEGIQSDDKPVSTASTGEFGLQLSLPIKNKSILWKKTNK